MTIRPLMNLEISFALDSRREAKEYLSEYLAFFSDLMV